MAAPSQILEENVALWNAVPTKVGSNPFGHRVHAAFFPIAPPVGVGAPTEALATSRIKPGNMVCAFNGKSHHCRHQLTVTVTSAHALRFAKPTNPSM